MKKSLLAISAVAAALLSGCAAGEYAPGLVFTDRARPIQATENKLGSKQGKAQCENILGLVALGDASISKAAANGGVREIAAVDVHQWSILGVYAKTNTIVSGE